MNGEKQFFMWKTLKGRKNKGLIQKFKHNENYAAEQRIYLSMTHSNLVRLLFTATKGETLNREFESLLRLHNGTRADT